MAPDRSVTYWIAAVFLLLIADLVTPPQSEFGILIVFVWVIAGAAILYRARKNPPKTPCGRKKSAGIVVGVLAIAYSIISIPAGISNAPFSVDELSVLLAGATLVFFSVRGYHHLLAPPLIPLAAILGYHAVDTLEGAFVDPLIRPTAVISVAILRLVGIEVDLMGTVYRYTALNGDRIGISIVSACTGIWSMAAYTAAVVIILFIFPRMRKTGYAMLALGYLGTYLSNVLRVVLISLSGYVYGHTGVLQTVHTHIGWVMFSAWMLVFWYLFFSLRLHVPEKPAVEDDDGCDDGKVERQGDR